jgi:hypothetical protein
MRELQYVTSEYGQKLTIQLKSMLSPPEMTFYR